MKNKKQKILILSFSAVISLCALLITIFCVQNNIPLLFDFSEKIIAKGSKAWLGILIIAPTIFAILHFAIKNDLAEFVFKILFLISVYEIMLTFIYLLFGTRFDVGQLPDIPLTCFIFIPLSVAIIAVGAKLKSAPFKSKLAVQFKCTKETEFIWKQTHFFASRVYLFAGLILIICSSIFSMFYLCYIMLIIFLTTIIICNIIIYHYSKSIYKKYISLKTKHDKLNNKTNSPSK